MTLPTVVNNAGRPADALPVAFLGSDGLLGGSASSIVAVGSLTRPSDTVQYAIGDLIAGNTTAELVVPIVLPVARLVDTTFLGRRLRLKVNDTTWKSATVRVHLFRNSPTVGVGDNGALNSSETYGFTDADYIGHEDIPLSQQTSDGFVKGFVVCDFISSPSPGTQTIFALLEARTAVTPGSAKVFTLALEALRD